MLPNKFCIKGDETINSINNPISNFFTELNLNPKGYWFNSSKYYYFNGSCINYISEIDFTEYPEYTLKQLKEMLEEKKYTLEDLERIKEKLK